MGVFTQKEAEYLKKQRLGRLATVDATGEPHVVPVGFRFDPEIGVVEISGYRMSRSRKYRDVRETGRAAFVVDDYETEPSWRARGVETRGRAEAVSEGRALIRLYPERVTSWGIEGDSYRPNARSVKSG